MIVGGGVGAWATTSGGSGGYRTAHVTRADIGTTLSVVGDVQPVSDASAAFQVAGQVATVTVSAGQTVTAGQTLGTLDTTALSETVTSAESTVAADKAKLAEDEANQSGTAASSGSGSNPSDSGRARTLRVRVRPLGFGPAIDEYHDTQLWLGHLECGRHRGPADADPGRGHTGHGSAEGGGRPHPGSERLHERQHRHHGGSGRL